MDEQERIKYVRLRNKLYNIKSNVNSLEKSKKELISLLNEGLMINNEIAENEKISDISDDIKKVKNSINYSISNINNKI